MIVFFFILFGCAFFYLFCHFRPSPEELMQKVFAYDLYHIKERCKKDHGYTDEDMIFLERELKRFLIMGMLKEDKNAKIGMYSKDVDNLWHSFILFTREYQNFCATTVGFFIHHAPEVNKERKDAERTPEEWKEKRQAYKRFIEVYEQLFAEKIHPIWLLDGVEKVEMHG